MLIKYKSEIRNATNLSSLHWIISLSFCSFLYNGVYFRRLKLSVSEMKNSQKRFQLRRKATFLATVLWFWAGLKMIAPFDIEQACNGK